MWSESPSLIFASYYTHNQNKTMNRCNGSLKISELQITSGVIKTVRLKYFFKFNHAASLFGYAFLQQEKEQLRMDLFSSCFMSDRV
jgi:hypothetical protein